MRVLATLLAIAGTAGAAGAESIRFDWTGTVSFADPSLAAAGIVVGTPAVGHYRFSLPPDADPDPQVGLYGLALLEWRVAAGLVDNTTTGAGFGAITVRLDFEGMGDFYQVDVDPALFLRLQDVEGAVFASDALPTTPPPLAPFEVAVLVQIDPNTSQPLAVIELETLSRAPTIPALPGWGAPALALALLAASRARTGPPRSRFRREPRPQ